MKTTTGIPLLLLPPVAVAAVLMAATATASAGEALWISLAGSSADTNWSDLSNWQGGVAPSGNSCLFNDATGVGADNIINNVVDTDENPYSLTYTNIGTFQNTLILPGVTLTIGGGGLTMGNTTEFSAYPSISPTTTVSGAGASLIASNDTINVGYSFQGTAPNGVPSLDLSGLNNFLGLNMANIYLGRGSVRMSGNLYLAATNYVYFTGPSSSSAPSLDIGDNSGNNGPGSALYLGQTNVFWVNDIGMGLKKQNSGGGGEILFNSAFNNPVAYFCGTNGPGSLISTWAIGDGQTESGTITDQGTADFSGGAVYAYVNNMWLGRNSTADSGSSPASKGTLTLAAGVFSVNNLTNGWIVSTLKSPSVTGTINVNGTAVLSVNNNLVLAATNNNLDLSTTFECQGELIINGGTVLANTITAGGGGDNGSGYNAYVYMTGGLLVVTNTMGSAFHPVNYFLLADSPTLQFGAAEGVTNAQTQYLSTDGSTVTINISSLPVARSYPETFPLISYQGGTGSGALFALGALPGTYTGYVSNDNSSMVWLVVTNGPALPKVCQWGGAVNDNWDTTSLNWTNNGVAVAYVEGDSVLFSDQAQSSTVNLTSSHAPLLWTVTNNVLNYTFAGSGVNGPVGLTKSGTASLTLSESGDNFSGGISVLGGALVLDDPGSDNAGGLSVAPGATVQIGNNDNYGSLPSGTITDDGTLVFDQTASNAFAGVITGTGGLIQEGSGTLFLAGSNSYEGDTTITGGTLSLATPGAIAGSDAINVTNATLDVSGVPGPITLTNLSLNNATLNIAAGYLQTNLTVSSLSMGGGANTINVESLPPIASFPTTIGLLYAPGGISGYNFALGTLPQGYSGTISETGNAAVVLTVTGGQIGVRPYVTWAGADGARWNLSWSDGTNWQSPGAPTASDYVIFDDTAAADGTPYSTVGGGAGGISASANINNVVDGNSAIAAINYSNVLTDYQNTFLGNGVTLTIASTNTSPRVMTVGSAATDFGPGATGYATIGGTNGTLDVENTNGLIYVGLGDSAANTEQSILDLSGLGSFNAVVRQVLIGVGGNSEGIGMDHESGVVYLAQTNNLTAGATNSGTETSDTSADALSLDVGDGDGNGGAPSILYLGETNAIYAGAIGVGEQKATGTIEFNPYYTNTTILPVAYFRGLGGNAVGTLSIGDGVVNSGTANCNGTCDFTAGSGGADGYINALIATIYVGRAANNTESGGQATGLLAFDNGIISAGTVYAGYEPANAEKSGVGTINVGSNADLMVSGTVYLGVTTGGTGATSTTGTLNITNGTVTVNNVVCGTNSAINMNGGTLSINGSAGGLGGALSLLSLVGGTVELDVNGGAGQTNIVAMTVTTSGTTSLKINSLSGVAVGVIYPLIAYTGTDPYSNLSLSPLPAGYQGTLVDGPGLIGLELTAVVPSARPRFTGISFNGGELAIAGTNGAAGGSFVLLESTNLTPPIVWTPVLTNSYDSNGDFNISTNLFSPATPDEFFELTNLP